ncbi:MAG TPA: nicotinamidase [Bacteroidales bacterium]|nr:nicotinamidase [Bacteroidales bacterium]
MSALLIVDVQNDFCEGGALGAPGNDEVVPVINNLMPKFKLKIASKDWHPEDTVHFDKWPPHCIRGTRGAEFHPELNTEDFEKVVLKGTGDKDDGYSSFEATTDNLIELLKGKGVNTVYIAGLTTDYCVKNTVLDAIKNGFNTFVIEDGIRAVDVNPGDGEKAIREMKTEGAQFIKSDEVPGE